MLRLLATFLFATLMTLGVEAKKSIPTLKLTTDNTITLNGPVSDATVQQVQLRAKALDTSLKAGYPIYLILNTPGGSIQAGLELIEYLKGLNRPVRTVTIFAASMGWQIAQHLGNRYILNYGVLMSHKAAGGFRGEFPGQLDSRLSFWKRRVYLMDLVTVKRTKGKMNLQEYHAMMENELWIGGMDSVKYGFADRVIRMNCSKALFEKTEKHMLATFFGNIELTFNSCPTITGPINVSAKIRTNKGLMSVEEFNKQGGVFREEMIKSEGNSYYGSYTYDLYALNPKVNHEMILEELQKHKYEFNNRKAVVKSY